MFRFYYVILSFFSISLLLLQYNLNFFFISFTLLSYIQNYQFAPNFTKPYPYSKNYTTKHKTKMYCYYINYYNFNPIKFLK